MPPHRSRELIAKNAAERPNNSRRKWRESSSRTTDQSPRAGLQEQLRLDRLNRFFADLELVRQQGLRIAPLERHHRWYLRTRPAARDKEAKSDQHRLH